MAACRESAIKEGVVIDGDEELWVRFTKSVQTNLHVVFTMNPRGDDFADRSTTSPALFNRCVVDWFGTWGLTALCQGGKQFTSSLDLGDESEWNNANGITEPTLSSKKRRHSPELDYDAQRHSQREPFVHNSVMQFERTRVAESC